MPWSVKAQQWLPQPPPSASDPLPEPIRPSLILPVECFNTNATATRSQTAGDFDVTSKLKPTTLRWLASQPELEVAESLVAVHRHRNPKSATVSELSRGTRLRVLATSTQPDGSKLSCIVLEGDNRAAGWLTSRTSDGRATLIPRFTAPQRTYEAVKRLAVRRKFELSSQFLCQLPQGTLVYIAETRKTPEGALRVRVTRVDQDQPLGWVTAKKSFEGELLIREVASPRLTTPQQYAIRNELTPHHRHVTHTAGGAANGCQ